MWRTAAQPARSPEAASRFCHSGYDTDSSRSLSYRRRIVLFGEKSPGRRLSRSLSGILCRDQICHYSRRLPDPRTLLLSGTPLYVLMMNKQAFHRKIFAAAALAFEYLLKQGRRTAQFGGYNVILQVFAAVALIALFRLYPAYAQQQTPTIAIIQPHDIKAYYEAVEGFLRYLGRDLKQDFN